MNDEDLAALDDVSDGSGLTSSESEAAAPLDAEAATDALLAKQAASAAGSAISAASEPIGSHILRGAHDDSETATNAALDAAGQEIGVTSGSGMMSLRSKVSGARGSKARKWDKVAGAFVKHEFLGGGEEGSDAAQAAAMADADLVSSTPRESAGSRIVNAVGKAEEAEEEAKAKQSADPHVQAQSVFRAKESTSSSSAAASADANQLQALGGSASRRSKSSRRRSHGRSIGLSAGMAAAAIDEDGEGEGGADGGALVKSGSAKGSRSRRKKVVSSSSGATVGESLPEEGEPSSTVEMVELPSEGGREGKRRSSTVPTPLALNDATGATAADDPNSLTSPRFWEHDREMDAPVGRQWLLSLELWVVPMLVALAWLMIPLGYPVTSGPQSPYLFAFAHDGVYSLVTSTLAVLFYRIALGPRQALGVPASAALVLVASTTNVCLTFFGIQYEVLAGSWLSTPNQHRLVTVTTPLISGLVLFFLYMGTLRVWGGTRFSRSDRSLLATLGTAFRTEPTVAAAVADRAAIAEGIASDGDAGDAGRDRATLNLWRVTVLGGTFLFVFYCCQLVTFAFTTYGPTVQLAISSLFPVSAALFTLPSSHIARLIDEAALNSTSVRLQPLVVWVNDLVYSMFLRGLFTQTTDFALFFAFELVQMVLDTFIFYFRLTPTYTSLRSIKNEERHRYGIIVKLYWVSMARRLSLTAYASAVALLNISYNSRFYPLSEGTSERFFIFLLGMLLVEWAWSTIITLAIRRWYRYDVVLTGAAMIVRHPAARLIALLVGVHAIQDAFLALNTFTFD
jgi:hypothetical protein